MFTSFLPGWETLMSSDGFVGKLKADTCLCVSVFVAHLTEHNHTHCERCRGVEGVIVCAPVPFAKVPPHIVTVTVSGNVIKFRHDWARGKK